MSNANLEVKQLYEEFGLSLDQIAEQTGYEVLAIKNTLIQCSLKFVRDSRKDMPQDEEGGVITAEDDKLLIETGKMLAFSAEDERVRADMIKYLHDEHKGRNDKDRPSGMKVNILVLNTMIQKARKMVECNEDDILDVTTKAIS